MCRDCKDKVFNNCGVSNEFMKNLRDIIAENKQQGNGAFFFTTINQKVRFPRGVGVNRFWGMTLLRGNQSSMEIFDNFGDGGPENFGLNVFRSKGGGGGWKIEGKL